MLARPIDRDAILVRNATHLRTLRVPPQLGLPNLATGWDDRPWHGDRGTVVYGRTVPLFRKICEDAKRFADENGIKRLGLAPLNEWGEGSYLEPCKEFGFEMYDALRDVFCDKPAQGWPPNITPEDIGLGPYDYPKMPHLSLIHI